MHLHSGLADLLIYEVHINVTDGTVVMNGTTSMPKSVLRFVLD